MDNSGFTLTEKADKGEMLEEAETVRGSAIRQKLFVSMQT
jgi:hypothetical protein